MDLIFYYLAYSRSTGEFETKFLEYHMKQKFPLNPFNGWESESPAPESISTAQPMPTQMWKMGTNELYEHDFLL